MKIIDTIWFTEMGGVNPIGIVVIETKVGERKAYIGTGTGISEDNDARRIAEMGAKLPTEMLIRILKSVAKEGEK